MGKVRKHAVLLGIFLCASLCWMLLIYWFSAQNAAESSDLSAGLLQWLLGLLPGYGKLDAAGRAKLMAHLHTLFRKLGHFSEYGVLGMLLSLTMRQLGAFGCRRGHRQLPEIFRRLLPVLLSCLYAVTDEVHQKFVAGRSCELRDVLIDTTGALCGVIVFQLVMALAKAHKRRSTKQPHSQKF